jgi:mannose-1-phosphate guanylyltransferase
LLDARANIVVGGDGRLTALVGVEGLVVVQAPGVTLVCAKEKAQEIKALVTRLRGDPARAPLL